MRTGARLPSTQRPVWARRRHRRQVLRDLCDLNPAGQGAGPGVDLAPPITHTGRWGSVVAARARVRAPSRLSARSAPSACQSLWRVTTMLVRPGSGRKRGGNESQVLRPMMTAQPRQLFEMRHVPAGARAWCCPYQSRHWRRGVNQVQRLHGGLCGKRGQIWSSARVLRPDQWRPRHTCPIPVPFLRVSSAIAARAIATCSAVVACGPAVVLVHLRFALFIKGAGWLPGPLQLS